MYYALTIKKTRGVPTEKDYEEYFSWLIAQGYQIWEVNYETTRGLHVHCILECAERIPHFKKALYRDNFGWNLHAVPIFHRRGWVRYSEKDSKLKALAAKSESEELIETTTPPYFDIRKIHS